MAMDYVKLTGGCCVDCLMLIANDDASGMDDATEAQCREGIHSFHEQRQCLVPGDDTDEFSSHPCAVCGSHFAGARNEVGYLTEKGQ